MIRPMITSVCVNVCIPCDAVDVNLDVFECLCLVYFATVSVFNLISLFVMCVPVDRLRDFFFHAPLFRAVGSVCIYYIRDSRNSPYEDGALLELFFLLFYTVIFVTIFFFLFDSVAGAIAIKCSFIFFLFVSYNSLD